MNIEKKIYPSITGESNKDWKNKLQEVKELEIKEINETKIKIGINI